MSTFAGDKSKVLRQTSIGRKNRLSLYKSKTAVRQSTKKRIREQKSHNNIAPKYMRVNENSSSDEIDVVSQSMEDEIYYSECSNTGGTFLNGSVSDAS